MKRESYYKELDEKITPLFMDGLTDRQIAELLGMTVREVKNAAARLQRKGVQFNRRKNCGAWNDYNCYEDVPEEYRKQISEAIRLMKLGKTNKDIYIALGLNDYKLYHRMTIAYKFGIPYPSIDERKKVYGMNTSRQKKEKLRKEAEESGLFNLDRHYCKKCKYRSFMLNVNNCDYLLITGSRRNCDPSRCDKYERGKRTRKPIGKMY